MRVGLRAESPLDRAAIATGLVPQPIFEAYLAPAMARAIMAGTRLGIFAALAARPDDSAGLAERLQLQRDAVDVLCTALHELRYLDRRSDQWHNAKRTERYLLPADRSVEIWTGEFGYDMWDAFADLERVARTGEHQGLHVKNPDDPYWDRYMRGLHQIARLGAPRMAKMLRLRNPTRLLDLAGGHGAYATALCRRHPGLQATVVDLEGGARRGRTIVAQEGMADRVTYVVGDLFETDLGDGYDAAMANSILHHFDPEACVTLLRRARSALTPGATMAVLELERPAPGRRGDQIGALTGLLFYVTSGARTYTADELRDLFARAGFKRVRARRHPELAGSVLVTGRA